MKIVVIGGSGLIGSKLVDKLSHHECCFSTISRLSLSRTPSK